ncbi:hypothetical protein JCM1841_002793 [Sporobolomyces salmonicolor]
MRRKSTRINPQDAAAATSHSTSANFPPADTATDQTSTTTNPKKRKSVAFEQHLELAGDDNQSPSHPSNARTTSTPHFHADASILAQAEAIQKAGAAEHG